MTKQVQRRRGTATQHTSFTGAEGELSVNTTNKSVHVHDGSTAGGIELARKDGSNVAFTSGTLDGVTIGGTTAGAGTFTNLTATGTTTLAGASTSANITFGDNDKAIFGAGSDLQIYHDGFNSIIQDSGTGDLNIRAGNLRLQNAAGTEVFLSANEDGFVNLYYDNSKKLATTSTGIDVTGTVTADGLTVDGDVNIYSGGPTRTLSLGPSGAGIEYNVNGTTTFQGRSDAYPVQIDTNSTRRMLFGSNGDVTIYQDNGTSSGILFDASVAETSFYGDLHVTSNIKHIGDSDTYYGFHGNDLWRVVAGGEERFEVSSSGVIVNDSGLDADFRVESDTKSHAFFLEASSSKVGIGEGNPSYQLDIKGDTNLSDGIRWNQTLTNESNSDAQRGIRIEHVRNESGGTMDASGTHIGYAYSISTGGSSSATISGDVYGYQFNRGMGSGGNTTGSTYGFYANSASYGSSSGNSYMFYVDNVKPSGGAGAAYGFFNADDGSANVFNGANVFNENGADKDFRVESDNRSNMLFVDGGADTVSVGDVSPTSANWSLYVEGQTAEASTNTYYAAKFASANYSDTGNYTTMIGLGVEPTASWAKAAIGFTRTASYDVGYVGIYVNSDTTGGTNTTLSDEKARFDASGNFFLGDDKVFDSNWRTNDGWRFRQTGTHNYIEHVRTGTSDASANYYMVNNANTYRFFSFNTPTAQIGSIANNNNNSVNYNTTSDHRLKENVEDIADGITRVKQLQPRRFSWLNEQADAPTVDGFIAHEAQAVVPEAVTGDHNETDADGNPVYQGIDQAKLVPLLTAALQEAIAKIETLETKVAALESAS